MEVTRRGFLREAPLASAVAAAGVTVARGRNARESIGAAQIPSGRCVSARHLFFDQAIPDMRGGPSMLDLHLDCRQMQSAVPRPLDMLQRAMPWALRRENIARSPASFAAPPGYECPVCDRRVVCRCVSYSPTGRVSLRCIVSSARSRDGRRPRSHVPTGHFA